MAIHRMLASHRLFRVGGIDVRIAYFLYVFIGAVLLAHCSGLGPALAPERRTGIAAVLLLYPVFVLLHELGHAVVAKGIGLEVRQIILHPMGGTAELRGLIPGPKPAPMPPGAPSNIL